MTSARISSLSSSSRGMPGMNEAAAARTTTTIPDSNPFRPAIADTAMPTPTIKRISTPFTPITLTAAPPARERTVRRAWSRYLRTPRCSTNQSRCADDVISKPGPV